MIKTLLEALSETLKIVFARCLKGIEIWNTKIDVWNAIVTLIMVLRFCLQFVTKRNTWFLNETLQYEIQTLFYVFEIFVETQ